MVITALAFFGSHLLLSFWRWRKYIWPHYLSLFFLSLIFSCGKQQVLVPFQVLRLNHFISFSSSMIFCSYFSSWSLNRDWISYSYINKQILATTNHIVEVAGLFGGLVDHFLLKPKPVHFLVQFMCLSLALKLGGPINFYQRSNSRVFSFGNHIFFGSQYLTELLAFLTTMNHL